MRTASTPNQPAISHRSASRGHERRIDEEQRDHQADHRAGRPGRRARRRRSPQRVQHFDRRGKRQQPADARWRMLGAAKRRDEREHGKAERDGREQVHGGGGPPRSGHAVTLTSPAPTRTSTRRRPA